MINLNEFQLSSVTWTLFWRLITIEKYGRKKVMKSMKGSKSVRRSGMVAVWVIVGMLAVLMAGPAQAALIDLYLKPSPVITFNNVGVNYDATLDELTVKKDTFPIAVYYTEELNNQYIYGPPTFDITANITDAGQIGAGLGTLTIEGYIPSIGISTATTLLTGSLTDFGFTDPPGGSGSKLQFLFDVTGGVLESQYGDLAGVEVYGNFSGYFNTSFNITGSIANTSPDPPPPPVPEPATITLILLGGGGLCFVRRKRLMKKN